MQKSRKRGVSRMVVTCHKGSIVCYGLSIRWLCASCVDIQAYRNLRSLYKFFCFFFILLAYILIKLFTMQMFYLLIYLLFIYLFVYYMSFLLEKKKEKLFLQNCVYLFLLKMLWFKKTSPKPQEIIIHIISF